MFDGALVKLTITPFEDGDTVQGGPPSGPPFIAQFNPETFTINREVGLDSDIPVQGSTEKSAKYNYIKPGTFSFDFLLDGTGATGTKIEVLPLIELFKTTVWFNGKTHHPNFLLIVWGTFISTCVLQSYSVNYKLLRPNGTPLRAVISASFREHHTVELRQLLENKSSPDLTHLHSIKNDEHLALVTHEIYKNPKYYYHVAEANKLNNLKKVNTGSKLLFPPIKE